MRVENNKIGRILHDALYNRMISFCEQYTPEIPAEPVVMTWLNRVYSGDDSIHVLVTLDDKYNIVTHMVIDVQSAYSYTVLFCHQVQADKGHTSSYDEAMEYLDKLSNETNAHCTVINVTKNNKVLEKKYGFTTTRSVMLRYNNES